VDRSVLEGLLRERMHQEGPLSLDVFQELALYHPQEGYYATQAVLGSGGDFTTAPEISQLFGEMVGIYLWDSLHRMGFPKPFHLLELGPGRGVLMADVLRTLDRLQQDFFEGLSLSFLEISSSLQAQQAAAMLAFPVQPLWAATLEAAMGQGEGPLVVVANEFFDALPVKQFEFRGGRWWERGVTWDSEAQRFVGVLLPFSEGVKLSIPEIVPGIVPRVVPEVPCEGAVLEFSPARDILFQNVLQALAERGGVLWMADYGTTQPRFGETLQGLCRGIPSPVLEQVGKTDLSAHVDFAALEKLTQASGLKGFGPVSQGVFLENMGIRARLEQLKAGRASGVRATLEMGYERLVNPRQMGTLFQVYGVSSGLNARPLGFSQQT
jgi:NADH dehydrogenase [ubiquinone] 1 alpha subcomplex assembly factor 7